MPKRKTAKQTAEARHHLSAEDLIDFLAKSPQYGGKTKQWMWLGVIGMSAMIFILWGWSLKTQLSSFSWRNTPEKTLLNRAQTNWDAVYDETKKSELEKELNKREIKNSIQTMLSQSASKTTQTSSVNIITTTFLQY